MTSPLDWLGKDELTADLTVIILQEVYGCTEERARELVAGQFRSVEDDDQLTAAIRIVDLIVARVRRPADAPPPGDGAPTEKVPGA